MADGSREPALLCVGNITIDETVQPDGRRAIGFGGDALFAALAARTVLDGGGQVAWLAPLGNDVPAELVADLGRAGLTLDGQPRRDLPTVRNVVTYAADGGRTWQLCCSDADFEALSVQPHDVPPALLAARSVLVTAMGLRAQCDLVRWLRTHTAATLHLDLQEDYIAGHEDAVLAMVADCDVFLPSEAEVRMLTGSADLEAAMRSFRDLGPRCVVVKRAERGCLVLADGADDVVEVPAERIEAVDSTGAGDAFCGAFAARYGIDGDALAAARAGAAAARLAVSAVGWTGFVPAAVAP
jgi:ribokinase